MWMTSLLTSGAMAFGRLLVVNIMPSAVVVFSIWLAGRGLALRESTVGQSRVDDAVTIGVETDVIALVLIVFAVAALAAIMGNFQFAIIRLFEGYWGTSWPLLPFYIANSKRHEGKRDSWISELEEWREELIRLRESVAEQSDNASCQEQRKNLRDKTRGELAKDSLLERIPALYPPTGIPTLPTSLGNAMRSYEHRAGERYGYRTLSVWPRLYPHLSDRLAAQLHAAIDALHAAVNLTLAMLIAVPVLAAGFWGDIGGIWLPALGALLAVISYRGAIRAAVSVGLMQSVSFDLHRFDMLTALHRELPATGHQELQRARTVTNFLKAKDPKTTQEYLQTVRYDHTVSDKEKDRPEKRT